MYIGPWQEFKLARILALKDKVDKENEESNQISQSQHDPSVQNGAHQKAYSVGTRMGGVPKNQLGMLQTPNATGPTGFSYGATQASNYSNSISNITHNKMGHAKSQHRAQSKYKSVKQHEIQDASYRYKVDQQYAPPPKPIPLLKAYDRKPAGEKLYQGIPGKNTQRNAHDIFNMPTSLGGKKKSTSTASRFTNMQNTLTNNRHQQSVYSQQLYNNQMDQASKHNLQSYQQYAKDMARSDFQYNNNQTFSQHSNIGSIKSQYNKELREYEKNIGQTKNQMPDFLRSKQELMMSVNRRSYGGDPNHLLPAESSKIQPSDNISQAGSQNTQNGQSQYKSYQQQNFSQMLKQHGEAHEGMKKNAKNTQVIDQSYEQWNRFENFLKFAQKKEIRDRLKEFDAPSVHNYIDPDTIDKIHAAKKPPLHQAKSKEKKTNQQQLEENKQRIQKMKELYGLFVKMENQGDDDAKQGSEDQQESATAVNQALENMNMSPFAMSNNVGGMTSQLASKYDQQRQNSTNQTNYINSESGLGKQESTAKLPEIQSPEIRLIKNYQGPNVTLGQSPAALKHVEEINLPEIPEDQLGRSLQNQNNPNNNTIKPDKFTNNFTSVQDLPEKEDIVEDLPEVLESPGKFRLTAKKSSIQDSGSILDKDVDGLLNWAKALPDDQQFKASGSSFFKQGIV